MKRGLTFVLAVSFVLASSALFAATRYFTRFSCWVPTGWYAAENRDYSVSMDSNYSLSERIWVGVGTIGGDLLEDIALDYYDLLRGRDFTRVRDYYTFTYDDGGYTWYAEVFDNRTQPNLTSDIFGIITYTSATDTRDVADVYDSIVINRSWSYGYRGTRTSSSSGGCNSGLLSLFVILPLFALIKKK